MSLPSSTLAEQVDQAIQRNPYLSGRKLRFETHGDRVVLHGVVGSFFQKQMAQEGLRHIAGLTLIDNDLEVSTS